MIGKKESKCENAKLNNKASSRLSRSSYWALYMIISIIVLWALWGHHQGDFSTHADLASHQFKEKPSAVYSGVFWIVIIANQAFRAAPIDSLFVLTFIALLGKFIAIFWVAKKLLGSVIASRVAFMVSLMAPLPNLEIISLLGELGNINRSDLGSNKLIRALCDIYLGQLSSVVWHNSTIIASIPFSLIACHMFITDIRSSNRDTARMWLCGVFLLLSTVAKPSFTPIFICGALIMTIFKVPRNAKLLALSPRVIGYIVLSAICILVVFYQVCAVNNVETDFGGITIAPFEQWSRFSSNIFSSVISSLAFPLASTLYIFSNQIRINYNRMYARMGLLFGWISVGLSVLIFTLFAELDHHGNLRSDGNFGWSIIPSMLILNMYAVIGIFIVGKTKRRRLTEQLARLLLYVSVANGIFYCILIALGVPYGI